MNVIYDNESIHMPCEDFFSYVEKYEITYAQIGGDCAWLCTKDTVHYIEDLADGCPSVDSDVIIEYVRGFMERSTSR